MPNYPGAAGATTPVASNASPIALQKGESAYVFGVLAASATQLPVNDGNVAMETQAVGAVSIAVNLQTQATDPPAGVAWEIRFSGAPGTFEIDIQEADTDADAFYVLPSSAVNANSALYKITAVIANNVARVEIPGPLSKFQRAKIVALGNAVNVSIKATRAA
jgi:hypothetical protein